MEIVLVIALVLINLFWIIYLDRRDNREQDERRELLNRVAEPEMVIPPKEVIEENIRATAESLDTQEFNVPEMYEHAAVGLVDPRLERREEDE